MPLKRQTGRVVGVLVVLIGIFSGLALASEYLASEMVPVSQGALWVYREGAGLSVRRQVTGVREIKRSDLSEPLRFVEITYDTKGAAEKQKTYYLLTERGILFSRALGPEARDFFSSALWLMPAKLTPQSKWSNWTQGTQMQFEVAEQTAVQTPAGMVTDCARLRYRQGLEESGQGTMTFCKGVGEISVEEGSFKRQLIEYKSGSGKSLWSPLGAAATEQVWKLLPQAQTVEPKLGAGVAAQGGALWNAPWSPLWLGLSAAMLGLGVFGWFFIRRRIRVDEIPADDSAVTQQLQQVAVERQSGDLKAAGERLQRLVEKFPLYPDIHFQLGLVKLANRNHGEAIGHFREAVKINPQYLDAHLQMGLLLKKEAQLSQALHSFEQILNARPDYADIHNLAGEVWRDLGEMDKARQHFERALAINPHFEAARANLQQRR